MYSSCKARTNSTSVMYRFHPAVHWKKGYPDRRQIVSQIKSLWDQYGLEDKTEFNTKVERVYKDPDGRWIINDPSHGRFDGVIAAIGTCGDPKMYVKSLNALHMKHTTNCIHPSSGLHYPAKKTSRAKSGTVPN
jgi:cation diffusion facilitator CzcD-associated flavoprotein CzcO